MNSMCRECRYCEIEYKWGDGETPEISTERCYKGHAVLRGDEIDCLDFKKNNQKLNKEALTECDRCKYLSRCGNAIESIAKNDTRRHFIKGRGCCLNDREEIEVLNLSEIIQMESQESMADEMAVIPTLQAAIEKFGDITFGELMDGKIEELFRGEK